MIDTLTSWLNTVLPEGSFTLEPLKGDASFRRYFRVFQNNRTYIAAHAPADTENNTGFITVSRAYQQLGLNVPIVYHVEPHKHFFLLSDLGNTVFFDYAAPDLYQQALITLGTVQTCNIPLPAFDKKFIHQELMHFEEWFIEKYLQINITENKNLLKILTKTKEILIHAAVSQPQCHIHRDYHSRNLMILKAPHNTEIGILDFQDAMQGPITYDLISLIRDCYIELPKEDVIKLALFFHEHFLKTRLPSQEEFLYYMDLMGIQRHLKAIFIFARKYLRDHNSNYLNDIPRTLDYIISVSQQYPVLNDFHLCMQEFKGRL